MNTTDDAVRRYFTIRATLSIGLVSIFLALRWYHPGTVIAQIDCFPVVAPWNLFAKSVGAWQFLISPLGSYSFVSYAPLYAVQGVLSLLLQPPEIQLLSNALAVFCGVRGAFALMRFFGVGIVPSWCAAWLYLFNPYLLATVVTFTTGSTLFAAAPWIINAILRGLSDPRERRRQRLLLVVVASVVAGVIGGTPQVLFGFFVMLCATTIFAIVALPRAIGYSKWLIQTCALAVAAAAWWLVPQVISLKANVVTHDSDPTKVAWTFAHASLANDFRLLPIWTWQYPAYFPFAARYDANVFEYASGFLLFGLTIVALIVESKQRNVIRFFLGCSVFAIIFAKGMHEPFVGAYLALLRLPGFFILIEPAGLLITTTLFLAISASFVLDRAKRDLRLRYAISTIAVVLGVSSAWSLVTGDVFHGQSQWLPSMHVRVPPYWKAAAAFINERDRRSMVVATPPDSHYEQQYDWGYYGVDLIAQQLVHAPVLVLGSALTYLTDRRQTAISFDIQEAIDRRDPNLGQLLRGLGIRFIIERGDVRLLGDDGGWLASKKSISDLVQPARIERFGPLSLIDLGRAKSTTGVIQRAGSLASRFGARIFQFEPIVRERTSTIPIVERDFHRTEMTPSFYHATATSRNSIAITGFNPSRSDVYVDLSIALPAKRGTRAYIDDGHRLRDSAFALRDSIQLLRFRNVEVKSGFQDYRVSFTEATSDAIGQTWSEADHLRLGDTTVAIRSMGRRAEGEYPHSLGEFAVAYRAGDHAQISVRLVQLGVLRGFIITPVRPKTTSAVSCFAPNDVRPLVVEDVLGPCVRNSLAKDGIVRIELVSAKRYPGRGRTVVSVARNVPYRSGAFTDVTDIPIIGSIQNRFLLGGRLVSVRTETPGFLLTGQLYDSRFFAVDVNHPLAITRLRQIFGWMGALPIPRGDSSYFVFNLISFFEGILSVISCVIVSLLSGRSLYSRFSRTSALESRSPVSSSVMR